MSYGVKNYLGVGDKDLYRTCPKILKYQFTEEFRNRLRLSDKCCFRMKEEPLQKWAKENNKPYGIIGIMQDEGGRRERSQCLAFSGKKLKNFQPLVPITKEWENWFINTYDIKFNKISSIFIVIFFFIIIF